MFTSEYFDRAIDLQVGFFRRNSKKALIAKQLSSALATVANRWEALGGYTGNGESILDCRVTYEALLQFQLDVMREIKKVRPDVLASSQGFDKKISEFENKLKKGVEHCSMWYDPRVRRQLASRARNMGQGMCSGYELLYYSPLTVLPPYSNC